MNPLRTILCAVTLAGSNLLLSGCGGPSNEQLGTPQTAEEARKRTMESIPGYAKGQGQPGGAPAGNQARPAYPQGQR